MCHCVVFYNEPRVLLEKPIKVPGVTCDGLASYPEGVSILLQKPELSTGFQISFIGKVSMRNCNGPIDMGLTKW